MVGEAATGRWLMHGLRCAFRQLDEWVTTWKIGQWVKELDFEQPRTEL